MKTGEHFPIKRVVNDKKNKLYVKTSCVANCPKFQPQSTKEVSQKSQRPNFLQIY
jgi:hypothetical protein